jgi:hypothetical protein
MHREAAAVCLEWSDVLRDHGRLDEAAETAERAAELGEDADVTVAVQRR